MQGWPPLRAAFGPLMSVDVLTFGLNHVSAPVSVRERVSLPFELLQSGACGLAFGLWRRGASEAAILSTCNRTEIYCTAEPGVAEHLPAWLADFRQFETAHVLQPHLYRHMTGRRRAARFPRGQRAGFHGAGRTADPRADERSGARRRRSRVAWARMLHQLFQRTFSVAKEVRSQTAIGAQSVSMAAASVRLAERVFGDLREVNVLLIGAGEMIELCATHFAAQQPRQHGGRQPHGGTRRNAGGAVLRRRHAADRPARPPGRVRRCRVEHRQLAAHPGPGHGRARHQGAPPPPDGHDRPGRAARHRTRSQPPATTSTCTRWTTSARLVQNGTDARQAAVVQAEAIIETRVQNFMHWMDSAHRGAGDPRTCTRPPTRCAQAELDRARKALARGDSPEQVMEQLAHGLTQKYLHGAAGRAQP